MSNAIPTAVTWQNYQRSKIVNPAMSTLREQPAGTVSIFLPMFKD
jgi:hypothetical protein